MKTKQNKRTLLIIPKVFFELYVVLIIALSFTNKYSQIFVILLGLGWFMYNTNKECE